MRMGGALSGRVKNFIISPREEEQVHAHSQQAQLTEENNNVFWFNWKNYCVPPVKR